MEPKATWAILMRYAHARQALTPIAPTSRLRLATQRAHLDLSDPIGFRAKCAAVISRVRYSILKRDTPASRWLMETHQEIRWATLHRLLSGIS